MEDPKAPTFEQYQATEWNFDFEAFLAKPDALENAIFEDRLSDVSQLLAKGHPVRQQHLELIAQAKKWEAFKIILNNHAWEINHNLNERTLPMLGRALYDEEVIPLLLDLGADPNAGKLGWTVLSDAVGRSSLKTVKLLFDRGGDPAKGYLLHRAATRTKFGLFAHDNLDVMRLLIEKGAPIDGIDFEEGYEATQPEPHLWGRGTPLQIAVLMKEHDTIRLLLDHGADPNAKDITGSRTALSLAEDQKDWLAVDLLKASKAMPRQGSSKV